MKSGRPPQTCLLVSLACLGLACAEEAAGSSAGSGASGTTSAQGTATTSAEGSTSGSGGSTAGTGGSGGDTSDASSSSSGRGGADGCPEEFIWDADCDHLGGCEYDDEEITCPDGSSYTTSLTAYCPVLISVASFVDMCCPAVPPQSGTQSCDVEGKICTYLGDVVCTGEESVGGSFTTTCEGGTWQTVYEPAGEPCVSAGVCPLLPPFPEQSCDTAVSPGYCIWERTSTCPSGEGFLVVQVSTCSVRPYAGPPLPPSSEGVWATATVFVGDECVDCPTADNVEPCVDGLACTLTGNAVCLGRVCTDGAWRAQELWHGDSELCD